MTITKTSIPTKKTSSTLTLVLYGLAGLVLMAAIFIMIYALTFRSGAEASLTLVRSAFGPIVSRMIDLTIGGIQSAGMLFSGLVFAISALLFATGKVTSRNSHLSKDLAELEARVAALETEKRV